MRDSLNAKKVENAIEGVFEGRYNHKENIDSRLEFLEWLSIKTDFDITADQIRLLWEV